MDTGKKKVVRRIIWIFVILLVIGGLAWPKLPDWSGAPEATAAQAGAPSGPPALSVSTYVVSPRPLSDRLVANGTVMAYEEVQLQAEMAGKVVHVGFEEGRFVQEGALLVKINDADLQAQLLGAQRRKDLAEVQVTRQRDLLQQGGLSQEAFDITSSTLSVLEAEIELIRAQIAKTEVRAPFSGVVGLRSVSTGAYVTPGTGMARLQMLDPIKIDFSIPERHIEQVRPGHRIMFHVQGVDGLFEGTIYAIEPGIDTSTRMMRLRASTRNPGMRLRPGAFAQIDLILDETSDALTVPSVALVPSATQMTVFLYRDGRAEPRLVQTGIRTDQHVQILSGIAAGDTVVVSGLQEIRPGLPLRIDTSPDAFVPDNVQPITHTPRG